MRVCCWGCWLLPGIFCQFGGFGRIVCVAPRSLRGSVEKRFLCVFCSELESADGFSDRNAVFFCEVCGWDLVSVRDGGFDVELLFGRVVFGVVPVESESLCVESVFLHSWEELVVDGVSEEVSVFFDDVLEDFEVCV